MKTIWKKREQDQVLTREDLVARLLRARGLPTSGVEFESYTQPRLTDLQSPFLLKNMQGAVQRLTQALSEKQKICVYGDFDLDGTSGLALLYEGLSALGFQDLVLFQPLRLKEGYGFHAWAVEELAAQGVKLILTVDVGITAHAAVQRAHELGVDVIITDHHLPAADLPKALFIVNPNQGDCPSGLGYLSGAGVAFYVIRALLRHLVDQGMGPASTAFLNSLLEFVVIATITDMVPMKGDNRALVRAGLRQLAKTQRAGLRALLEMIGLSTQAELSAQDVAIRLAPKLNALSRMELGLRPVDILLEQDFQKAQTLMSRVQEQNSQRIQLQQDGENRAKQLLGDSPLGDYIFVYDRTFHRGVIGLIATKLAKEWNRPTFIGAWDEDGNITGSARLPDGYAGGAGLTEALSAAAPKLLRFGGHYGAAGFELHQDQVAYFEQSLNQFYHNLKQQTEIVRTIEYDFDLEPLQFSLDSIAQLQALEPFGQSFEAPLFVLHELNTIQVRELKGGHLKVWLRPQHHPSVTIEALAFGLSLAQQQQLRAPEPKSILFELQKNEFRGVKSPQARIVDVRLANASAEANANANANSSANAN